MYLFFFCRCRRAKNVSNGAPICQLVVPHYGAVNRRRPSNNPCRKTVEHSGNSPRSAKSNSSSSPIGNITDATSASNSAIIELSRRADDVVSISPNHPSSSPIKSPANFSSGSTGSGSVFLTESLVVFLETGHGWLWSEE